MSRCLLICFSFYLCACSTPVNSGGGNGIFLPDGGKTDGTIGKTDGTSGKDGSGDGLAFVGKDGSNSEISVVDSEDGSSPDDSIEDSAPDEDSSSDGQISDEDINGDDGFFDDPDASKEVSSSDGSGATDCNARAKIVYVVTEQNVLLSFQPDKLTFKVVGTLNCPAGGGNPFSMSVDRNADAWVLYQNAISGGGIYKVSTLDASCTATKFKAGSGGTVELFGMGFSANSPGSTDETLFVAGASGANYQTVKNTLATIAFPSMALSKVATIDIAGGADLTGNAKGELFGFFPDTSPPSVRQIDKTTGFTTSKSWPLPSSSFNSTQAWAFAQWGGTFYLFFKSFSDPSTNVWTLDPVTGTVTKVKSSIGYTVVGAGVSSCAPSSKP